MSRLWVLVLAMLAAACHHADPYPWPRPGQPSATALENELSQRDSLQDAANDVIAVAAAIREAVARVYPAATWTTTSAGGQAGCEPPFVFLSGSIYELPKWQASAPTSPADAQAVVAAAADVLRAHGADNLDLKPGQSVRGALPREHGTVEFTIRAPYGSNPPDMVVSGATGCHHVASGPGPWNTPPTP
ncbi:MAG: LppA family lipoprotein [Mycobacterium sp.]